MNTPIYQPYTYLIGWTYHNKWYYGCQYGKTANPSNLWTKYFTSSKEVKKFVECYGQPDIVKIRKIFSSGESCRIWEHKVLKKLKVVTDDKWLNKTDNVSIDYQKGIEGAKKAADKIRGKKQSEEHLHKRRQALMGHTVSSETRKKISESRKDKNIPSPNKGKKMSLETKQKISESMLNRKRKDDK